MRGAATSHRRRGPAAAVWIPILACVLHICPVSVVRAFDAGIAVDTTGAIDDEDVAVDMAVPDSVAAEPDTYAYTFAAMPTDGDHHIAWFEPKAVAPKVHHMLLFGCEGAVSPHLHTRSGGMFSPGGGEPRGSVCENSRSEPFIFGWGKNAPPLNLPDRVGFEVGGDRGFKHLVLEVHYLDPQRSDANGTSGLTVHLRRGRPNRAMSVVAFAQGFSLPPGKPRVSVRNACVYTMARPLKAFAFRVHAHALGVEVYAERLVGGKWPNDEDEGAEGAELFPAVRLMGRSPQLAQLFERIDDSGLTIHPGDKIRVTCVYDTSNRTEVTRAGWGHGDEMCNLYLMVHAEEPAYLSCTGSQTHGDVRMAIQHSPDSESASAKAPEESEDLTAHLVDAPGVDKRWPKSLGQVAGIVTEPDGRHAWAFHRGRRLWDGDSFDPSTHKMKDLESPIAENTIARIELATGKIVKSFGANEHYMPHAITLGPDGDVWVTDCGLHQVIRYNASDGARVAEYGQKLIPGKGKDGFCKPTQVAVAEDNSFWVSDGYCNDRVARFDSRGEYAGEFKPGTDGDSTTGFEVPHAIELDSRDSTLYVADRERSRITAHSLDGSMIREYDLSPHGLVYGLSVLRSEELGLSGLYALTWRRDAGGDVRVVWIPTDAGRPVRGAKRHRRVSWSLPPTAVTTPHAVSVFGGVAGGTSGWGRGVNLLVSETRPTLGDVNLHRIWIGVDAGAGGDDAADTAVREGLKVVPPRGWVEGARSYVDEAALPGSDKAAAPTMVATKGKRDAPSTVTTTVTTTTTTTTTTTGDAAREEDDDEDDGEDDDDGDDGEEEPVVAPQHGGGGGDLLPGGGIAGIGAVKKHALNRPQTTKPVEVGDANAAHSPLPLAFGMMIAVGASLLVFCIFSLPNGSSELAHSLRYYAFRGKQAAKGRHRRLHDEV